MANTTMIVILRVKDKVLALAIAIAIIVEGVMLSDPGGFGGFLAGPFCLAHADSCHAGLKWKPDPKSQAQACPFCPWSEALPGQEF